MRHMVTVLASAAVARAGARRGDVGAALREGDLIVDLRARYESVEQGGFASSADALTNRLRAGFQTAPLKGTAFLAEGVIVDDLVDDYNSTTNGQAEYPVVADPADFAAVNRLAVINKSLERTTLTFGRQRIIHDDQRFVGNVGWRQNEQTLDALRAQWAGTKLKTDLTYASQVNRVFGPDSPQGKWEGDVTLASFAYTLPIGTLSLFDYYLDIDGVAAASTIPPASSSRARSLPASSLPRMRSRSRSRGRPAEHGGYRRRLRASRGRLELRQVRLGPGLRAARRRWRDVVLDAARDAARFPGVGRQVPDDAGRRHRGHIRALQLAAREARLVHELRGRGRVSTITTRISAARISAKS